MFRRDKSKKWLRVAERRGIDTEQHVGVWSYQPDGSRWVAVLFDDRVVVSRGGRLSEGMGYGSGFDVVPLVDVVGVGSEVTGLVGWVVLWGKGFEYRFPMPRRLVRDARGVVESYVRDAS